MRTTAKEYAANNNCTTTQARRLLRKMGAKESLVKKKVDRSDSIESGNRRRWYMVIMFELDEENSLQG